jgi:hypothetical protein
MARLHPYQLYISLDALNLKKHANPKEYITIKLLDKPVFDAMLKKHSYTTLTMMDPKHANEQVEIYLIEVVNNYTEEFIILFEFDVVTDVRDFLEYLTFENAFGLVVTHLLEKYDKYIYQQVEYMINFKPKLSENDAQALDNL